MRIFKGLMLLTMVVVAISYWVASKPKQEINIAELERKATEHAGALDPKPFSLSTKDGRVVRLEDFKGRPVLLNFWATWCPPCVEELPSLLKFAEWARKELGLETIAVSVDTDWKTIDNFFAQKKLWSGKELPLTILLNSDSKVAAEYGSTKYPETFFINRDFKIARKFVGVQDWNSQELKKWISENLQ